MIIDATFKETSEIMDADFGILAKGEKGDKGEPFTFNDLTDEQKAELGNTAIVNLHEKRITNLEKKIAPEYFLTDADVKHEKVVPSNACPFALVNKIGGMTYKCNNLIPFPYVDSAMTRLGITFTPLADGGLKAVGTSEASASFTLATGDNIKLVHGKTYNIGFGNFDYTSILLVLTYYDATGTKKYWGSGGASLVWDSAYTPLSVYVQVQPNQTVNTIIYPMLNEGTTALPFEPYFEGLRDTKVTELVSEGANLFNAQTIPDADYTVNEDGSRILVRKVTSGNGYIVTKAKLSEACPSLREGDVAYVKYETDIPSGNNHIYLDGSKYLWRTTEAHTITKEDLNSKVVLYGNNYVQGYTEQVTILNFRIVRDENAPYKPYRAEAVGTFTIKPELIDILEAHGYGRGIKGYEGYIDLDRGVFVPPQTHRRVLNGTENWIRTSTGDDAKYRFKLMTEHLIPYTSSANPSPIVCDRYWSGSANDSYLCVRCCATVDNGIYFYDDAYQTIEDWEAHLTEHPITIEYAIEAVPTPIPISLTDDTFIEVEGGGIIRAVNDDGRAAPSEITYMLKE